MHSSLQSHARRNARQTNLRACVRLCHEHTQKTSFVLVGQRPIKVEPLQECHLDTHLARCCNVVSVATEIHVFFTFHRRTQASEHKRRQLFPKPFSGAAPSALCTPRTPPRERQSLISRNSSPEGSAGKLEQHHVLQLGDVSTRCPCKRIIKSLRLADCRDTRCL